MVGFSHLCVVCPELLPSPSSMNKKSFQPSVALYLLIVPFGTYNVALLKVFLLNVSYPILNGFVISEITVEIFAPANAPSPILVTLLGMVTEVRPEQSANAPPPMLVTLLGMVTEVRPEQNSNA